MIYLKSLPGQHYDQCICLIRVFKKEGAIRIWQPDPELSDVVDVLPSSPKVEKLDDLFPTYIDITSLSEITVDEQVLSEHAAAGLSCEEVDRLCQEESNRQWVEIAKQRRDNV